MRMARVNPALAWCFLALQLAVGTVSGTELLLCVGAAGHLEVEAPHGGSACHSEAGLASVDAGCIDIPLMTGSLASPAPELWQVRTASRVLVTRLPDPSSSLSVRPVAADSTRLPDATTRLRSGSIVLIV